MRSETESDVGLASLNRRRFPTSCDLTVVIRRRRKKIIERVQTSQLGLVISQPAAQVVALPDEEVRAAAEAGDVLANVVDLMVEPLDRPLQAEALLPVKALRNRPESIQLLSRHLPFRY